ncbi:cytochrome c peroxidase [Hymenobacter sp. BT770]|uniref:cytochrome-c peroxidase n=1 Tax=Hymenobacter sp. BT770 TaxID=2886942 RepID=UPI001D117E60|nr:cytochrome c peroxidase [Hymenobacter sp. BT770]MCC3155231.1 cytochrome-c peroxidase [Hymenobacter sp. BT770]MDO3417186.1 cytochrome c peroxidase [Hymenobacter sp. BT770]
MLPVSVSTTARLASVLAAAALLVAAVSCQKDAEVPANDLAALPLVAPAPTSNVSSPEKIALGRALFWDPVLSGGKDVSCASCHHPATGYADAIELSIGVNGQGLGSARRFRAPNDIAFVKRNSSTVLNTAFNGLTTAATADPASAPMFWDSRAQSLENQSLLPVATLEEMRGHRYAEGVALDSVVARLRRIPAYATMFRAAFAENTPVTATNIGKAIACFERTLVATDSRFDEYMRGNQAALSTQEVAGLNAFVASGCAKCHSGPMLSDYQVHVLGVADNAKNATSDAGVNGTYAFRTPSLRNVALTAPYMHSGTLPTLQAVLNFYDPGRGRAPSANPHVPVSQRDPLFPDRVNDAQAIIAFLGTLTATSYDRTVPAAVPSGLPVGGNIR